MVLAWQTKKEASQRKINLLEAPAILTKIRTSSPGPLPGRSAFTPRTSFLKLLNFRTLNPKALSTTPGPDIKCLQFTPVDQTTHLICANPQQLSAFR